MIRHRESGHLTTYRQQRTSAPEPGDRFGPRHLDLFNERLGFLLVSLEARTAPEHYGECNGQVPGTGCMRLCRDARALARDRPRLVAELKRAWSLIPPGPDQRLDDRELQWLSRLVVTLGRALDAVSGDAAPSAREVETLSRKLSELRARLPRGEPG